MSGETVLINLPTGDGDVFDVNGTPRAMQHTACTAWPGRGFCARVMGQGAVGRDKGEKAEEEDCLDLLFFSS